MSSPESSAPAKPTIELGTSLFREKYLFAFGSQPEVLYHLRTQAVGDGTSSIPELLRKWGEVQARVQELTQTEAGLPDTISIEEIPEKARSRIERLVDVDFVHKTFQLQYRVAIVEIDKLVAPQRTVNLDFIYSLRQGLGDNPSEEAIQDICLSSERETAPIQHLELGQNRHVFTSPSVDFRFLGAFLKRELTPDDLAYAEFGGVPAAAIISFIGYGTHPISGFLNGQRAVLQNGFHRVYALRSLGVQKIPMIVQLAHNAQIEFPPNICGVPRDYLLGNSRPALMKDFFDEPLSVEIKVSKRLRMVSFQAQATQHDVPA